MNVHSYYLTLVSRCFRNKFFFILHDINKYPENWRNWENANCGILTIFSSISKYLLVWGFPSFKVYISR